VRKPRRFLDGTPIERGDIKRVVFGVMPEAYEMASEVSGDALARSMMYAARRLGEAQHGLPADVVESKYFTQKLLRQYLADHPLETADWSVVWDDRGSIYEPYSRHEVKLGNRPVRQYIHNVEASGDSIEFDPEPFVLWLPMIGPKNCFQAIVLVEKAGLADELLAAEIPERHSVAVGSTRGQSTTGWRQLAEWLAARFPSVPILVAHDFDVVGLSIVSIVAGRDTLAHRYVVEPNVIDIGLRLEDVEDLISESVSFTRDPLPTLLRSGAKPEEIAYLRETQTKGRRAELNALVGHEWPRWIERKLIEHGLGERLVPDAEVLAAAYRRAVRLARLNREIERLAKHDGHVNVPDPLVTLVTTEMASNPAMPWDVAIAGIAEVEVLRDGGDRP
jgi:hypothetical protein